VVAGPDGHLLVGRHQPGRGAWLCAGSEPCLAAAARRSAFARALRGPVAASEVVALGERLRDEARESARMDGEEGRGPRKE